MNDDARPRSSGARRTIRLPLIDLISDELFTTAKGAYFGIKINSPPEPLPVLSPNNVRYSCAQLGRLSETDKALPKSIWSGPLQLESERATPE
jgi:hypothetical protein